MRVLFVWLLIFLSQSAQAAPAQIILIRHGEKEGNGLSVKGEQRAVALVPFFLGNTTLLKYGLPVAIYAEKPHENEKRQRPLLTITPLAKELNLTPITNFEKEEAKELVDAIVTNSGLDGKTVLICWEHETIPDIAQKFGGKKTPNKWPKGAYDRVWIIENLEDVTFTDLPQQLLYKDSSK